MKFHNSSVAKAQLRRKEFNRYQNNRFIRKSYLSKTIDKNARDLAKENSIKQAQSAKENNIKQKQEEWDMCVKLGKLWDNIVFKINYYQELIKLDTWKLELVYNLIRDCNKIQTNYCVGEITVKQCVEGLEEIEKKLDNLIKDWTHGIEI